MKLVIAAIIYIAAFAAHLACIHVFRDAKAYSDWLATLNSFGGKALPGTNLLLSTLRFWWLYPLVASAVFFYGLVIRKRILAPLLFMLAIALLWGVYLYGPIAALGQVV